MGEWYRMKIYNIFLPWPPSTGNTTTRHTKKGHHYTKPEIITYRREVALKLIEHDFKQIEGKQYEIIWNLYPETKRAVDIDNIRKVIADAVFKKDDIFTIHKETFENCYYTNTMCIHGVHLRILEM